MSFDEQKMWLFTPSGDACPTCEAMAGVYSYEVSQPHPNCHCVITAGEAKSELISTREELVDEYESAEEVTWVPKGGESSVSQEWSTGTESSVTGGASAEGGGFGINFGGSEAESSSSGGSKSVTFHYDDGLGGDSQLVVAMYLVRVYQTIETYRAHWSEGMGMDFQYDVIAGTREERTFIGYKQEAF